MPSKTTILMRANMAHERDERAVAERFFPVVNLRSLVPTGSLVVATASGGQTKYNRVRLGLPKTYALDAACVGPVGTIAQVPAYALTVKCTGRGSRQRTRVDAFGFPRGCLMREKHVKGFATGDMVRAVVPASSKKPACTLVGWRCDAAAVSTSRPRAASARASHTGTAKSCSVRTVTATP